MVGLFSLHAYICTCSATTSTGAGSKFRKSDWYSVFQGRRKFDLFAERDETVHAKQRRLVSRAYSMESLKDFEIYVDDAIKVLFQRLEERKEKPIDVGNWAQLFAFGKKDVR